MDDYARAIRHMLQAAEREGVVVEPVEQRPSHVPDASVLTVVRVPRHRNASPPTACKRRGSPGPPAARHRPSPRPPSPHEADDVITSEGGAQLSRAGLLQEIAALEAAISADKAELSSLLLRRELKGK